MDKLELLNIATDAYNKGQPFMSDKEWDDLYFELGEQAQNIRYEVVSELQKVEHEYPMLSLDKTKNEDDIFSFIKQRDIVIMGKMDGLTCALTYLDGELVRAETRGNGVIGEDITHNAMVIPSIPKKIEYKDKLTVFGEIICKYDDFETFNNSYKNPRNFAAGSIRLLDANECAKRKLTFVAWDAIAPADECNSLADLFYILHKNSFIVVPYSYIPYNPPKGPFEEELEYPAFIRWNLNGVQELCQELSYPIDGLVIKYDNIMLGQTLGRTEHHFNNALAFKFYDETYETELLDIEWSMGRTGVLTPIAIFKPVEIDGSTVERASLHNLSIMDEIFGSPGPFEYQKISVFKANMIIPQIEKAFDTDRGTLFYMEQRFIEPPEICPVCGGPTEEVQSNDTKQLICTNPACQGKLINRIDHFASKKGLDIKGLSKKTIEKLIDECDVSSITDLYNIEKWSKKLYKLNGFGEKSVNNLIESINQSRLCNLQAFICSLGIPLVGSTVSKLLSEKFNDYHDFRMAIMNNYKFFNIPTIGPEIHNAIMKFDYSEADKLAEEIFVITNPKEEKKEDIFAGKTFVITGKLKTYKNRAELESIIKQYGGKVSSSVSKNTSYLINNDINSTSSKNESAKKLGVEIITEENFKNFLDL